ncbi:hypothetical protein BU16DRAFT_151294 [Lophium mytilinum]|uniref:Uncharacterized protein n=1 Tax=Lophium mytilinum TaxID=390894 RepID=A0A6A6QDN1_9PEZI|nr:hypothetical protein BU16DRAFT_151294 [Lophium mytilinum]
MHWSRISSPIKHIRNNLPHPQSTQPGPEPQPQPHKIIHLSQPHGSPPKHHALFRTSFKVNFPKAHPCSWVGSLLAQTAPPAEPPPLDTDTHKPLLPDTHRKQRAEDKILRRPVMGSSGAVVVFRRRAGGALMQVRALKIPF